MRRISRHYNASSQEAQAQAIAVPLPNSLSTFFNSHTTMARIATAFLAINLVLQEKAEEGVRELKRLEEKFLLSLKRTFMHSQDEQKKQELEQVALKQEILTEEAEDEADDDVFVQAMDLATLDTPGPTF